MVDEKAVGSALARSAPVVFFHIPKTAGTTFRDILEHIYPASRRYLMDEPGKAASTLPSDTDLVYGHWTDPYVHSGQPSRALVTMVREPLQRFLSHYHYVRRVQQDPEHDLAMRCTAEEFFVLGRCYDDFQARRLALPQRPQDHPRFGYGRAKLFCALKNIKSFDFVGVSERFDESLVLLKRLLSWEEIPLYVRLQSSGEREHPVPPALKILAYRHLAIDYKLYQIANDTIDTLIEEQGESFYHELREYRERLRRFNDYKTRVTA